MPSVGPRAVRCIQALRRLEEEKVAATLVAAERHKPSHVMEFRRVVHRVHLGCVRFQPDVCGRRDHRNNEQPDPPEQRMRLDGERIDDNSNSLCHDCKHGAMAAPAVAR